MSQIDLKQQFNGRKLISELDDFSQISGNKVLKTPCEHILISCFAIKKKKAKDNKRQKSLKKHTYSIRKDKAQSIKHFKI